MALNNITNFLAEVSSKGLARSNRWEVVIDSPLNVRFGAPVETAKLSLYCSDAFLPMQQIFTTRQQIYGPSYFKPVGHNFGGENMTLLFYLDADMNIKRYFDTWMDAIVDRYTSHTNYRRAYLGSMTVAQLDQDENETYKVKITDVFPITQNVLQLDQTESTPHKLAVTFTYRKWEVMDATPAPKPEKNRKNAPTYENNFGVVNGNQNLRIGPNFRGGYVDPTTDARGPEAFWVVK